MSEQIYLLSFKGVSEAEANQYAEELRETLLDATTGIAVQRQRENPLAQDLGATLVLIMGAPAVVAAVHAIDNWPVGAKLTKKYDVPYNCHACAYLALLLNNSFFSSNGSCNVLVRSNVLKIERLLTPSTVL